jgi:hypothetical protein
MQGSNNALHDAAQGPPVTYDAVVLSRGRRLGFLHHHGPNTVEAFDIVEQSIGVFENEHAAVAAICRRAHGQVLP